MILPNYTYRAQVTHVVDGDTIDALVDVGFRLTAHLRLRIARVNTPELTDSDPEVRAKAYAAKNFTQAEVQGQSVIIQTEKADAFGRYLAEVWYLKGLSAQLNLSDQLIEQGHAVLYVRK